MQITYAKPADRGVTTLMYVGDDDAVDKAIAPLSSSDMLLAAAALIVAMQSRGVTRMAAATVAGWVGVKYYKSRR